MHYIDDISSNPWSIIDFRKYCLYLEMRKERDKFLKSIREMNYQDWLIEKKLIEAGGLGKTVYVLPARGGGPNVSLSTLKKYYEEGRDIQVVTLRKYDWPKITARDVENVLSKPWRDPFYESPLYDYYLYKDFDLRGDLMTRTEMIEFIKKNPNIPITHSLFADDEFIMSTESGNVYDESGYLFEDWYSPDGCNGWNGIRMRKGGAWENGWTIKE